MNILIYSPAFYPSVGGLELMARILAEEFTRFGHQVTVVTRTPSGISMVFPFNVIRNPSPFRLASIYSHVDVVLHMNVSLRALWPLAIFKRPLIVVHNGYYRRPCGRLGIRDRLKYWITKFVTNISCSTAVKNDIPAECMVIGNAYDDQVFGLFNFTQRTKDLLFVGRLVSEKGVDLLLRGLAAISQKNTRPTLTIIGSGPEDDTLRRICRKLQLLDQVTFAGKHTGNELAVLINQHRIMVVPSRNEGFGIVALEGIACGCVVVGSDTGGLPEAIGECGIIFRNGDVEDLSRSLLRAMTDKEVMERFQAARESHLACFSKREVAKRYLAVIEGVVVNSRAR